VSAALQFGVSKRRQSSALAGELRELRWWGVARSDAAIAADYNQRLRGDESGLLGYWPLLDGGGSQAEDRTRYGRLAVFGDGLAPSTAPVWSRSRLLLFDGLEFSANDIAVPPDMRVRCEAGLCIQAWLLPTLNRIDEHQPGVVFRCGDEVAGIELSLAQAGNVRFTSTASGRSATLSSPSGALNHSGWTHVAAMLEPSGDASIWVAGVKLVSGSLPVPAAGLWPNACIGGGYVGVIDELRLSRRSTLPSRQCRTRWRS
jgi:hypothetical protein